MNHLIIFIVTISTKLSLTHLNVFSLNDTFLTRQHKLLRKLSPDAHNGVVIESIYIFISKVLRAPSIFINEKSPEKFTRYEYDDFHLTFLFCHFITLNTLQPISSATNCIAPNSTLRLFASFRCSISSKLIPLIFLSPHVTTFRERMISRFSAVNLFEKTCLIFLFVRWEKNYCKKNHFRLFLISCVGREFFSENKCDLEKLFESFYLLLFKYHSHWLHIRMLLVSLNSST